jgi:hypothetical protein
MRDYGISVLTELITEAHARRYGYYDRTVVGCCRFDFSFFLALSPASTPRAKRW